MSIIVASVEELVFTKQEKIKEFTIKLIPEDLSLAKPTSLMFKVLTNIKNGVDVRPNFGFLSPKTKNETSLKIKFSSTEDNLAKLQIKWLPSSIADEEIDNNNLKHEQFNEQYKIAKERYPQKHLMITLKKVQEPMSSFNDSPSIGFKKSDEKVMMSKGDSSELKVDSESTTMFNHIPNDKEQTIKKVQVQAKKLEKNLEKKQQKKTEIQVQEKISEKSSDKQFSISKINFIFALVVVFLLGVLFGIKLNKIMHDDGAAQLPPDNLANSTQSDQL